MGLWDDSREGQRDAGERETASSTINDFQMGSNTQVLLLKIHTQHAHSALHEGLKHGIFLMRVTGLLCGKSDNINFNMAFLLFNAPLKL